MGNADTTTPVVLVMYLEVFKPLNRMQGTNITSKSIVSDAILLARDISELCGTTERNKREKQPKVLLTRAKQK